MKKKTKVVNEIKQTIEEKKNRNIDLKEELKFCNFSEDIEPCMAEELIRRANNHIYLKPHKLDKTELKLSKVFEESKLGNECNEDKTSDWWTNTIDICNAYTRSIQGRREIKESIEFLKNISWIKRRTKINLLIQDMEKEKKSLNRLISRMKTILLNRVAPKILSKEKDNHCVKNETIKEKKKVKHVSIVPKVDKLVSDYYKTNTQEPILIMSNRTYINIFKNETDIHVRRTMKIVECFQEGIYGNIMGMYFVIPRDYKGSLKIEARKNNSIFKLYTRYLNAIVKNKKEEKKKVEHFAVK